MEDNKYKDALERAKSAIKECGNNLGRIKMIESIFPDELGENKDEKIRKKLIEYFKGLMGGWFPYSNEEIIAYLEKVKDFDKQLEDAYNEGYKAAQAEMEKNRLTACENQTEAEAKREMDFAMDFFKKNKRQPTYSDCIEETRRKMIKEVTKWLDDNASLYFNVYWDKKEWIFENGKLNADLKKSMGL